MERENGHQEKTILVVGGTGKTGRRVVQQLEERALPVRVGSRSGKPPFDWEDKTTWAPALEGVGAAYVSYYPDLAMPGAVEVVRSFTELAVEAAVGRLVLLTGRGEEEAQRAERVVRESGTEWTIVRCAWFNQNFSESYLLEPLLAGEVLDGRNARLADGVRHALGREARDFADYARETAATGVWDGGGGALYVATLIAALGCGLVAGTFLAFSSFVMAALKRLTTAEGIVAMQSINILVVTPPS